MTKVRNRKQDIAWQHLFERFDIAHQIEQNGEFQITSKEINKYVREFYVEREDNAPDARNLLKFDFSSDLPEIFKKSVDDKIFGKQAKFTLMPMGHDNYAISDFKSFESLQYEILEPIRMTFPSWISGIDPSQPDTINSEAVAQSVAEMSGMLQYVMDDLDANIVATLSGKKGTGLIEFKINHYREKTEHFTINGWQSEIDGVYESPNRVLIVEAKKRRPEDFNIRQLYIPTRIYHDQMMFDKEIYSAYFTYTDNVFSFHVYQFEDINDYNSLRKIREYEFVFEEESKPFDVGDLKHILATINDLSEPVREDGKLIPFVQADDLEKIFEVPSLLQQKALKTQQGDLFEVGSKDFFAEAFKFDVRQSDYYANAAEYFGLAVKKDKKFLVTDFGKIFVSSDYNTKIRLFAEKLSEHIIFKNSLSIWLNTGHLPDKKYVENMILEYRTDLSGSTVGRRAGSVLSILKVFISKIE